jgi:hypothetical protein
MKKPFCDVCGVEVTTVRDATKELQPFKGVYCWVTLRTPTLNGSGNPPADLCDVCRAKGLLLVADALKKEADKLVVAGQEDAEQ